jgi:transcriptional regulator with XRE-family HTH domain
MLEKKLAEIGKRIKEVRLAKNISQVALATACGFEKASMSRIEAGRVNITVGTLYKISIALDIQLKELFK